MRGACGVLGTQSSSLPLSLPCPPPRAPQLAGHFQGPESPQPHIHSRLSGLPGHVHLVPQFSQGLRSGVRGGKRPLRYPCVPEALSSDLAEPRSLQHLTQVPFPRPSAPSTN